MKLLGALSIAEAIVRIGKKLIPYLNKKKPIKRKKKTCRKKKPMKQPPQS